MTGKLFACAMILLVAGLPGCKRSDGQSADAGGAHAEHGDEHDHGKEGAGHEEEGGDQGHSDHGDDEEAEKGKVHVSGAQRERFAIGVQSVGPGELDVGMELPGEVRPDGNRVAHIVPRFPGIVKEVRRNIGDSVRTGDVLAIVESSESLAPYPLTTLLDGTIIEKHLTRGEAIDREKQAFIIADLSTVWIDASVFQKDLDQIRIGQRVQVFANQSTAAAEGKISYITPVVDAPTRTATARVVLPNTDGRWRPGMFVTVRVLDPVQVSLIVQRNAVQTIDGKSVVFVETDDGFAIRPVTLGRAGATQVEVLSGLTAGERYATTNTFLLKAEAGKGSAEHEH